MKFKYFGLALAAVTVIGVGLLPFATAAASVPTQYVALGDSFAEGDGSPVGANTGYVGMIANTYFHSADPGPDNAINLATGQSNTTTASLISDGQLADAVGAIADPATDTTLVTLTVGGNDLLQLLGSAPCKTEPTGLACQGAVVTALGGVNARYPVIVGTLAGALDAQGADADLVVTTYYNPFNGTGSQYEGPVEMALMGQDGVIDCAAIGNPYNVGLNDIIACTATYFGAEVVDIHPLFVGRAFELTNIADNDIHPNIHGHRVIAEAVIEAVSD